MFTLFVPGFVADLKSFAVSHNLPTGSLGRSVRQLDDSTAHSDYHRYFGLSVSRMSERITECACALIDIGCFRLLLILPTRGLL